MAICKTMNVSPGTNGYKYIPWNDTEEENILHYFTAKSNQILHIGWKFTFIGFVLIQMCIDV